jgi:hypothetical protein
VTADTIALAQRSGRRARTSQSPDFFPISTLASVLSCLLQRPVAAEQVSDRSVGLGLARPPAPGQPLALAAQAASRLFLAGYGLPALADRGTWELLGEHLRACRHVFALLRPEGPDESEGKEALHLHDLPVEETADARVVGSPPGGTLPTVCALPLARFRELWAEAGQLMIVAARRWVDLPAMGAVFFGGHRYPDGAYHWHVAECLTDGEGRILRC